MAILAVGALTDPPVYLVIIILQPDALHDLLHHPTVVFHHSQAANDVRVLLHICRKAAGCCGQVRIQNVTAGQLAADVQNIVQCGTSVVFFLKARLDLLHGSSGGNVFLVAVVGVEGDLLQRFFADVRICTVIPAFRKGDRGHCPIHHGHQSLPVIGPSGITVTVAYQRVVPFVCVGGRKIRAETQPRQGLIRFGDIFHSRDADKTPQIRGFGEKLIAIVGGCAAYGHLQPGIQELSVGQDLRQGRKQLLPFRRQENTQPVMIRLLFPVTVKGMADQQITDACLQGFYQIRIHPHRPLSLII